MSENNFITRFFFAIFCSLALGFGFYSYIWDNVQPILVLFVGVLAAALVTLPLFLLSLMLYYVIHGRFPDVG